MGNPAYGALLLGVYGAARALPVFPVSWGVYRRGTRAADLLDSSRFDLRRAQCVVAAVLAAFGAQVSLSALLVALWPVA